MSQKQLPSKTARSPGSLRFYLGKQSSLQMSRDDSQKVIDTIAINCWIDKQNSTITKHTNSSNDFFATVSSSFINNPFTQ